MPPDTRSHTRYLRRLGLAIAAGLGLMLVAACQPAMTNQPRYKPLAASSFFDNGMGSRPLVPDTVSRENYSEDAAYSTGKNPDGTLVDQVPIEVNAQVLARGQQRFDIYCSPCHGLVGDGNGVVVQRGFPQPPTYHSDRLRNAPAGHFFDVITNGFGRMYSYGDRVSVPDRWAIVAYIRALQFSQHADVNSLSSDLQQKVENGASQ